MTGKKANFTIRLCRPDDLCDYTEIDRLERECAQGTILRFHFAPDDPRKPRPRAFKFQDHVVTVAERDDGRMVGTCSGVVRTVRVAEGRYEKVGWVFSLRVGLTERRSGIASRLILDMEERLQSEFGVKFIFDSIALDNIPSVRLFERFNYNYMWKARFYGINISHTNKMLDKHTQAPPVGVQRLDRKQSRSFLHKHYSKSFLYPDDSSSIYDSNVYVACQGENLVAVNLWAEGDKLGIIAIPFYLRLLYYIMIFLSFLFPGFFEKPLPLSRPWQMRWAYPILVDCSSRDRSTPTQLFTKAIERAVRDLQTDGTDVLMMPAEKGLSGLQEANYNLVRKCSYVSPLMRGTGGMIEIGKQLDDDADDIVVAAARNSFWFLNNSI